MVGITGSSGKTGTKDLTAGALGRKFHVHASPGSFNNEIGLPFTLLGAPAATEAVVLEMGARFPGNIADLCAIARPDVGVITNIGLSHAGCWAAPDGIALVKGELLEALAADGLAVLDAGDPATPGLAGADCRVRADGGRGRAVPCRHDAGCRRVPGRARRRAPALVRGAVGVGIRHRPPRRPGRAPGRERVTRRGSGVGARGAVRRRRGRARRCRSRTGAHGRATHARSGALLIDDAYNANPASMAAALRALERVGAAGRTIAVVGDMLELGDATDGGARARG